MIENGQGDLMEADVQALVNAVNCVGVMGKGIALQFKLAYPAMFEQYKDACDAGTIKLGKVSIVSVGVGANPTYIINFPTKYHFREKSKLESIDRGLESLVTEIRRLSIKSIAIPALGCGLGGLDVAIVKPRVMVAMAKLPDVRVLLFEPGDAMR